MPGAIPMDSSDESASKNNFIQSVSIEELAERFHEAISEVIRENLKAGISDHYENESGHWVKENPDGTVETI